MKNFRQYRYFDYTQEEYQEIWETATFVFDTSALLNLYKYKEETRNEFFKALEKIKDRLWIPHHIALEFNKNRLTVISREIDNFSKTIKIISELPRNFTSEINKLSLKKTHKIDTDNVSKQIKILSEKIIGELESQLEKEIKLKGKDPIRDKIFELFDGKIGSRPTKQEAINGLEKEAERRFKLKIAPGFGDSSKDEVSFDKGLQYQKRYSDYIIWQQILEQAKNIESKNLIFVTGDSKKGDWFLTIEAKGEKAIQPKPEILDEALNVGGLDNFLMYDTEDFITYAGQYLNLNISQKVIEEVGNINKSPNTQSNVNFVQNFKNRTHLSSEKMRALMKAQKIKERITVELTRNKGLLDYPHQILDCPECSLETLVPNNDSYTGYRCLYCENEESDDILQSCDSCGTEWSLGDLHYFEINDEIAEYLCPICCKHPDYINDD
ncbi:MULTISPECIES: PIN-like domain-containing protein [unclassified Moraxella]|uniref:PIN-like domain-containing protein n=1 Tax=unclassified Moraxella TaxID=2685852 RepID=UPI002B411CEF|nr:MULTISPECIES: PIN-like domain-containing protein [unclassified Moraxella]